MHTDRKIGFAMGILLIGIVAALFFRNEPLLSTQVSGVRREKQLNQELRQRDVAVYLSEEDSGAQTTSAPDRQPWTLREVLHKMDERNKTAPVPVGASSFSNRNRTIDDEVSLDGYRPSRDRKRAEPITPEKTSSAKSESAGKSLTDSLPAMMGAGEFGALPPLMPVESANPIDTPSSMPRANVRTSKDSPAAEFQPPESFEEYVVKYGDTLSGIAQRMLGSQAKYMEIYNANRDRMASPDRLEVGKPLRIPRAAHAERPSY